MELLIFVRFIIDYFWEFKILNIVHTGIISIFALLCFFSQKNISFKVIVPDILIFLFISICFFSFIRSDFGEESIIDFFKMVPLIFYYIIGRCLTKDISLKYLSYFSISAVLILFLCSISGIGYQYWGSVNTFSGGYFFKTDLALAILIFLSISLAYIENSIGKLFLLMFSIIIVFLANSRISIPILFLIMFISLYPIDKLLKKFGRNSVKIFIAILSSLLVFSFIDFSKMDMVGFDIKDPFSENSTQGRNLIWAAILDYYNSLSIFQKIFGAGMASDLVAASVFYQDPRFEAIRAHSSYLWLLICTGWLGLIFFIAFLFSVFNFIKNSIILNRYSKKNVCIFICLLSVFILMSFTVELIIRTQITYILFFFAGLCCNIKIFKNEKIDNP